MHGWIHLLQDFDNLVESLSGLGAEKFLIYGLDFKCLLLRIVDAICASVCYTIGDIDWKGLPDVIASDGTKELGGHYMMGGLSVGNLTKSPSKGQRDYILQSYLRLRHEKGIKTALQMRDSWLERNEDGGSIDVAVD